MKRSIISKIKRIPIVAMPLFMMYCMDGGVNSAEKTKLDSIQRDQQIVLTRLENLDKKIVARNKDIDEIKKSFNKLDKSIKGLEESVKKIKTDGNLADNKKNDKPKSDPNKVYDIPVGASFVLGNPDAKVTITEWMDFQ